MRRWQQIDPSLSGLSASVNVSPRQLRDSRFVQDVARSLERSDLNAADLTLEITEGAVMADVETAVQRLHALRSLGVSLAIDDFGTGHSSLALLRRLPVDTIKVDKMFVDTITTDATAAAFLESIVRMAEILSLAGRRRGHRDRRPGGAHRHLRQRARPGLPVSAGRWAWKPRRGSSPTQPPDGRTTLTSSCQRCAVPAW